MIAANRFITKYIKEKKENASEKSAKVYKENMGRK